MVATSHLQLLQGKHVHLVFRRILAACISQQDLHDKRRCVVTITRLAVKKKKKITSFGQPTSLIARWQSLSNPA